MTKTRILNKTVTTALILLLTLSILSVINLNINVIEIPTVYGTNISPSGSATVFYVNATHWSNDTTVFPNVKPINAAIGNATANYIIKVTSGTYNSSNTDFPITINLVNLTIQSTGGAANTIINASYSTVNAVTITTNNVTLDGFNITGVAGGENTAGVMLMGVDNCTIKNNILTDNSKDAINLFSVGGAYSDYNTVSNNVINGPASETFGIKIKGSHNTISGNKIYNTDTPILIWSWDDSETASPDFNIISGNTIGKGADTAPHKYGIEIKTGRHNVVTGNTISNATYAAIHLYTSDRMVAESNFDPRPANNTISGNIITGGEVGICLLEGARNNTISGNTISGTTTAGILGALSRWPSDWVGTTLNFTGDTNYLDYLQIVNNTIKDNTITNCGHGIAMQYADDNTLTGNTIEDNTNVTAIDYHGVAFPADAAGVYFDGNSTGNVAHYNNIAGNAGYGLKSGALLNATLNWWGHSTGPSVYGNGYGDAVSANVTYDPWLSAAYPPATVFEGIWLKPTRASAGSTIEVFSSNLDFTANETVRTYFEASLVNTTTAFTNGSLYATFTVPNVSAGTYTVTSVGETSGKSYSATFTIPTLSITLTPTEGPPGKTVTVTGEGFTRLGLVRIYFDVTLVKSISADAYGKVTTTFTVPTTTVPGSHTVKANDASTGNNATKTFTVPTPALISLTPTAGPPGTTVTVTGGNFTVSGTVGIYFGATFAVNMTADLDGGISGSVTVPSLVPGTYDVKGKDWSNGVWTSPKSFTVPEPSITLAPTSGPPGKSITINGTNFKLGAIVYIYFGGISWKNVTAHVTYGNFTTTAAVPDRTAGTYTVNASDGINYDTATFTIPTPSITLTPAGGPSGTTVTIEGINFKQLGTIYLYFNYSLWGTSFAANGTGGFSVTRDVPTMPIGSYIVNATDTINYDTATFDVGAVIDAPSPAQGPPATLVTITGRGFTANGTVQIYFDGTLKQTTTANSNGNIDTNFTVPDKTAGTYPIKAFDVNASIWTPAKNFTILSPSITLNPTTGQTGQSVTINGINFKLNGTITLWFADTLWGSTFTADSAGGFSVTRTVPSKLPQNITVTASDTVNNATAYYNLYGTGGIDTVQAMLQEIEAKLDEHGSFYNFTNTWFTTISNKLGTFTGTDTVASLLYEIKTSVSAMNLTDIAIIKTYVIDIEAKLDNTTYGLAAIKNAVDAINFTAIDNKLGTFTGTDTAASLLYNIKTSVNAINWTDINAIKAKTDAINWADIGTIKDTTRLSIDYLWGLQDHPLWGLRTKVVPMLESIKNATQFTAGTYSTIMPNSTAPVNLAKSSKVTLTVRTTDDTTAGFVIKVYIYDGTAWQPLAFSVPGIASADCAATVEFTTGTDGTFYFETTGATFTAFIYSAESAP